MLIIGERIKDYLLTDTALISLLGEPNIFAVGTDVEVNKGIFIDYSVGEDMNSTPAEDDILNIYIVVNRSIENYELACIDIATRVDDILNKKEHLISTEDYRILNFSRKGSSGIAVDEKGQEITYMLAYTYIIQTGD